MRKLVLFGVFASCMASAMNRACNLPELLGEQLSQESKRDNYNPEHVAAKILELHPPLEFFDHVYRRIADQERNIETLGIRLSDAERKLLLDMIDRSAGGLTAKEVALKKMLVNPLHSHQFKTILLLERSNQRLRQAVSVVEGKPRQFVITPPEKVGADYSGEATRTGLRYRGNPDFIKRVRSLEAQAAMISKQLELQLDFIDINSPAFEGASKDAAEASRNTTYYTEMRRVAEGDYTGIPDAVLATTPYPVNGTLDRN